MGMIDFLNNVDSQLFLALNELHTDFLDPIMKALSGKWIWVPFYIMLLFLVWRDHNKRQPALALRRTLLTLMCITLAITLADQICASALRPLVERPRPANEDSAICELVHIVDGYRGGHYGFPSCHAANSFALSAFIIMLFRNKIAVIGMLAWALLLCYTRIYLGVHYPGDLLVGAVIGSCIGICCYMLYSYLYKLRPLPAFRQYLSMNDD